MRKILVLNVGSSSCKFQLFSEDLTLLGKGLIDKIGINGTNLFYKDIKGNVIKKEENFEHKVLAEKLKDFINENNICDFKDVYLMAHRIVMGGELFKENILVEDKETIKKIISLTPLAPLHQPYNASLLEDFFIKYNHIKYAAIFDTTFHTTMPEENYLFSVPFELYEKHQIRRYGAHGTSHEYILKQVKNIFKKENVTFINLHLGNGASVCLIENSKSKNTSMGLTPLGGLMMGTRTGDLDPSIAFYLINQKNYSPKEVENIFIKKSGLLGIYEKSSDMRDVLKGIEQNDKKAILARKMFVARIRNYLAMYLNEVKEVDAITFTAGIGENDHKLIKEIFDKFYLKKIILKEKIDSPKDINLVSKEESEIKIYIIKTNEELSMAKIAKNLLKNKSSKLKEK